MTIYTQKPYCVYLTVYSGNKLPPFYIGSTSTIKIIEDSYHGTVSSKEYCSIWKSELKNNKHLFKSIIICTFNDRKSAYAKEEKFQRLLNVVKSPMYINKSYANKNFVAEKGKQLPLEWRNNISKAQIGRKHSQETRLKQSLSGGHRKGCKNSEEENEKIDNQIKKS